MQLMVKLLIIICSLIVQWTIIIIVLVYNFNNAVLTWPNLTQCREF